ncbi:hypothetical protein ACRCPS_18125 [Pseudomonas aeruginosa]
MKTILINLVLTLACIAAYDHFRETDSAQSIAVVNYDSVIKAVGEGKEASSYELANDNLRADASKLSAAGFVVIDSRVLVNYPVALEVPVRAAAAAPVEAANEQ